ncbi:MAG: hypothetical protein IJA10_13325 [Lachnospiraceae bacterium]|nr:hypothetical protein [Lachnospiraceae bacterium]
MERKGIRNLLLIVICLGLVIGCVLLEAFVKKESQKKTLEQNTLLENSYHEEEVETGQESSGQILYEDEELICYEDRVFCRFLYHEEDIGRTAAIVEGILENCPVLEHVYVVPIPHRILLEAGYTEDKESYLKYMKQLSDQLPQKSVLVNTLSVLQEHSDEYIFFRTEDAWTTRGAYYGTEALCNELGFESIPLEQYYEYMYASFRGGLMLNENLSFTEDLEELRDQNYYYLLPDTPNMAEVMGEDSFGKKISYKKPIVTSSSRNLGAFIDSTYFRAIVEGKTKDTKKEGQYLLLLCDSVGRLLVPYLKDYYEGVYVVNINVDDEFYYDLNEIVEEYQISDVVFAQNAMEMGDSGYSKALNDFCKE